MWERERAVTGERCITGGECERWVTGGECDRDNWWGMCVCVRESERERGKWW